MRSVHITHNKPNVQIIKPISLDVFPYLKKNKSLCKEHKWLTIYMVRIRKKAHNFIIFLYLRLYLLFTSILLKPYYSI